jgi:hypothetical protein
VRTSARRGRDATADLLKQITTLGLRVRAENSIHRVDLLVPNPNANPMILVGQDMALTFVYLIIRQLTDSLALWTDVSTVDDTGLPHALAAGARCRALTPSTVDVHLRRRDRTRSIRPTLCRRRRAASRTRLHRTRGGEPEARSDLVDDNLMAPDALALTLAARRGETTLHQAPNHDGAIALAEALGDVLGRCPEGGAGEVAGLTVLEGAGAGGATCGNSDTEACDRSAARAVAEDRIVGQVAVGVRCVEHMHDRDRLGL